MKNSIHKFVNLLLFLVVFGCSKENPIDISTESIQGGKYFTASPLALSDIKYATPLGNLNPPGHTLPTDHVYFYWVDPDHRISNDMTIMKTVFTPADGIVQYILQQSGGDYKIGIKITDTINYYLDHVMLRSDIHVGSKIKAGDSIGTTSPNSYALDLGLINYGITLKGFVNPSRYPEQTLHTNSPYKYYTDTTLRNVIYSKVRCNSNNKDGKIDYDISGKLVGNWFLEGLPTGGASSDYNSWSKHLAFVYDMTDPGQVRIAVGGTLSLIGVFSIQSTVPKPSEVTKTTGLVKYKLGGDQHTIGYMLVKMIEDDKIKVEIFPGNYDLYSDFTSNAKNYIR